jgi:glycogen operon protein
MGESDWNSGHARCLAMTLPGDQIGEMGESGERVVGDTFVILMNAHDERIDFRLGTRRRDLRWRCVFDTGAPDPPPPRTFAHMSIFPLQAHSMALLCAETLPAS